MREMAFRGHWVPATELYRFGAAADVVPMEKVQAAARSLATEIAAKSPRLEQDYTARTSLLADSREARDSFREKRSPQWNWR